jgi:hypothetical protein
VSDRDAACAMYRRFYGGADPRVLPLGELCSYLREMKGVRALESGKTPDLRNLAVKLANQKRPE